MTRHRVPSHCWTVSRTVASSSRVPTAVTSLEDSAATSFSCVYRPACPGLEISVQPIPSHRWSMAPEELPRTVYPAPQTSVGETDASALNHAYPFGDGESTSDHEVPSKCRASDS